MKDQDMDQQILHEIRFGFIHTYMVAGMAEPWSMKIERTLVLLEKQGIGAILTLTEEDMYDEEYLAYGFLHHHEPIDDCEAPTAGGLTRAINFINESLEKGKGVAVHCLEGRGRTGVILCAWLALKEGLGPELAITRIHDLRIHTIITPPQRVFLNKYLG